MYPDIFESAKFSLWLQKLPTSRRVPRTPLRILASEYASLGARNLYLELWHNEPRNQRKMRRVRLTPRRVRERTWERGCHIKYSIHGNELARISGFSVHTIPDSQRIQKFPLWRADSKSCGFVCRIHWLRVDGSRIQKKISLLHSRFYCRHARALRDDTKNGCVADQEKMRIQKFLDTCGQGLKECEGFSRR